jgi:DNA-directed RNA polymerase subunit RPC12/RpoP
MRDMKLKKVAQCRSCKNPISTNKVIKGEYIHCPHCGRKHFVDSKQNEEQANVKAIQLKQDTYPKKKASGL